MTENPMTMVPVLRQEPGVQFNPVRPAGFRILAACDAATKVLGFDLWVSCGSEGHKPMDPHTLGEAIDLSVHGLTPFLILRLKKFLEQTLGKRFTVLYECPTTPTEPMLAEIAYVNPEASAPHMHLQRDKGTEYPPLTPVPHV